MPVPSAMVTRFFQLILNKQFAEAERELERIKQKMHKTEWNRGYFRALYGMLLVKKSNANDSYAFFAKLNLNDRETLQACRQEFLEHVRNRLHGDFDRGFFAAWADFTRIISKLTVNEIQQATPQQNEEENGKKPPDDESQAKIEDFIE
ncbi:MAG: hypothetical protein QXD34_03570 [Candidatus Bathyarchaeia archaeon]|nr:hypothetical protein [Candidatus Bathyarchaeota archaeon]